MATAIEQTSGINRNLERWTLFDWQEHLQAPGRRLIELYALTENSFLQIGESLQSFYGRASKVSSTANQIADNLLGEEASETISRLQLLVERMSIYLNEIRESSQRNEKSLHSICTALDQLNGPLSSFQKITKTLQVIGITTRVECSGHVETSSENSSVLSDSLRRLAVLIAGNMEAIVDQVNLLQSLSEQALHNESALNNEQSQKARDAVDRARNVLVNLGTNHEKAAEKSENLAHFSAEISKSIGEIVSSMQFHDITRQQIEHVNQTIDALAQEIENGFALKDEQQQKAIEHAVSEGCRLQAEQLGHARNELSAAVWRIIESLHTLSHSVTKLSRDTCELAGTTEKDGATYFTALEPAIESVASILVENSSTASKSLQAVVNVVCAAEEMTALVEEIERFGAEMKVLSLNASVEAVHAKSGGSSLSVIADSIQDLANESLLQTEGLARNLKEITRFAEELGGGDVRGAIDKSSEVDQLTLDANEILEELRARNNGLSDGLGTIEESSGVLAVDIAETAASIRIHEDVTEILSRSIEDLDKVIERFPPTEGAWQQVQHIPLFREMLDRYSMKSERDIHLRVLRQENEQQVSSQPESERVEDVAETPRDLGNNVELF